MSLNHVKPNLLLVDDSAFYAQVFTQQILKYWDVTIQTVGSAHEAFAALQQGVYHLILLDIMMPDMDGLTALRQIRQRYPQILVVIMSSAHPSSLGRLGFDVGMLNSVTFMSKPSGREGMQTLAKQLQALVPGQIQKELVAKIDHEMVARHSKLIEMDVNNVKKTSEQRRTASVECIAMVVSTGGPITLQQILGKLPSNYPIPIVIVQHMSAGFLPSFVDWLCGVIQLPVKIVQQNQRLSSGVWIAPEGAHLLIQRHMMVLDTTSPPVSHFKPSGTVLLDSLAKSMGAKGLGVVLTGLGKDGAQGLLTLKEAGGYTIIQAPSTCVISGMVQATRSIMEPDQELSPSEMGETLLGLVGRIV